MKNALVFVVLVTAISVTGCADASNPEQLTTRCEGPDKVFILDDPNHGSSLFVLPNHADCN